MANSFVHVELSTTDLKAATKFYKSLFDWKLQSMDMGGSTYVMIDAGDGKVGGGMQKKQVPEAPAMWLSYVEVADVKKTIAKAKKLGANAVLEYQEVPGMGALGIFVDPSGAALGVWQPAKPAKKPAKKAVKKAKK